AKNVALAAPHRSGQRVAGEAQELAAALGNLLDNAVRYTPAGGGVRVDLRVADGMASIEVVDEGPGLPEPELARVFERFYRAPGDPTEGSGLGLAVVRSIAQRLGGRADLCNRCDRSGLIARLVLPLTPATEGRRAASERAVAAAVR